MSTLATTREFEVKDMTLYFRVTFDRDTYRLC